MYALLALLLNAAPASSALQRWTVPNVVDYAVVRSSAKAGVTATDGLAVALSTTTPIVRIGQPLLLTIQVDNVSSGERVLFMPNAPCAYTLLIGTTFGHASKLVKPVDCLGDIYNVPRETLAPGTATRLTFRFAHESMHAAGIYRLAVRSFYYFDGGRNGPLVNLRVNSNVVKIEVTKAVPRD